MDLRDNDTVDEEAQMSQRTTIGWSLFSSGITAIVLTILPYPSWWWGVALIIVGVIVISRRVV